MKSGLPTKDTSMEASADYMHVHVHAPDLTQDRKVHFMLEDLEAESTAVPSEHVAQCDEGSISSEEQSSSSDTDDTTDTGDDTTDASDNCEDIVTVQAVSSEFRGSPAPSSTSGLKIDQLLQQFIETGQHPSLKLHSLDQLTR
jgi:hypothetical protein